MNTYRIQFRGGVDLTVNYVDHYILDHENNLLRVFDEDGEVCCINNLDTVIGIWDETT